MLNHRWCAGLQVEQQRDYTVDLEARKAGLRARLAAFEKVGAWKDGCHAWVLQLATCHAWVLQLGPSVLAAAGQSARFLF